MPFIRINTEEPAGFQMQLPNCVVVSVIATGLDDDRCEATLLDRRGGVYGGRCWSGLDAYDLLNLFGAILAARDLPHAAELLDSHKHLATFKKDWGI